MVGYRFESAGQPFYLHGKKLSEGGEGIVVPYGDRFVIKLFFEPTQEKEDKIRFLIANSDRRKSSRGNSKRWIFPYDVILNHQTGKFAGYIMDRVPESWPISFLHSTEKVAETGIKPNSKALATMLANMWELVRRSHEKGMILGDLTPGNLMFNRKAMVTAIDIDSVQIAAGNVFHGSGVGTALYLAPEISRGGDLSIRRMWFHDVFSAAIVSYQTMTGGWHFTEGIVTGNKGGIPPNLAKRTKLGLWPYSSRTNIGGYQIAPPPGAVDFSMWGEELCSLFRITFDTTDPRKRPKPEVWRNAFLRFANCLKPCDAGKHQIYRRNQVCPWCALAKDEAKPPAGNASNTTNSDKDEFYKAMEELFDRFMRGWESILGTVGRVLFEQLKRGFKWSWKYFFS